jgi:hypothetical protein
MARRPANDRTCRLGGVAWCCALLGGTACSSSSTRYEVAIEDAGTKECLHSCFVQEQEILVCDDGFGGTYTQYGPLSSTCFEQSCDGVVLDPNYGSGPCESYDSFPSQQDFLGSCTEGYHAGASLYQGASADGGAAQADGATCANDGECSSSNCVSADGQNFFCASPCSSTGCPTDFTCLGGYCFSVCGTP